MFFQYFCRVPSVRCLIAHLVHLVVDREKIIARACAWSQQLSKYKMHNLQASEARSLSIRNLIDKRESGSLSPNLNHTSLQAEV